MANRVEWTRLEGNDVEAVIAMLVNRERVDSVRITPSRGDGGVDILDRGAGPDGSDVVYQVKRFTEPLSTKQKNDVEESLKRLKSDPRWESLTVVNWYLVTPWDPTPEADAWLQELGAEQGVTAIWRGLAYVERLVAQYPSVVDYYLHGGRDRIQDAYQALAAMFALPGGGPGGGVDHQLNAAQLVERIQGALPVLDGDPHYRYELRFGEDQLPPAPSRPNLVMSWITGDKRTGRWAAVDVIARCAAAAHERPITISFTVAPGSGFEETLRDFFGYGTPFTSPQGAYQGQVTAPGGLGGPIQDATVTTGPVAGGDLGEDRGLHLEVIDADGNTVAEVDLDRIDRSQGSDGARVVLREEYGTFIFEDRYNLSGGTGTRSVRLGDFTGQPVDPVLGALRFLQACRPGNTGRVSRRNTPPELGLPDPNLDFSWPAQQQQELAGLVELLDTLSVIQRHTSLPIVVPDLNSLTPGQANNWRLAAKILQGKEVTLTYPAEQCLILDLNADLDAEIALGQTLLLAMPLIVAVAGHELDLGPVEMRLSSPTLVARDSHPQQPGRTRYVFTTPDRRFQLRRPGDQQAQQSAEPGEHSDTSGPTTAELTE